MSKPTIAWKQAKAVPLWKQAKAVPLERIAWSVGEVSGVRVIRCSHEKRRLTKQNTHAWRVVSSSYYLAGKEHADGPQYDTEAELLEAVTAKCSAEYQ